MSLQAIHNIPEICAQLGITDVVLSPGSRCAPLTIAFARHPNVQVRTVPDERAAAFIGLGLAQAQRRAVALVCTSGTAGLNYAPAVAEAFFQQIPLVVFTADRPPEWIDQLDGQTIRQTDLYGAHAKGSFTLPVDTSHPDAEWHAARIVSEAINLAQRAPAGPVQVNVPLREPFYPKAGEELTFGPVKVIREVAAPVPTVLPARWNEIRDVILASDRTLVVLGQQAADSKLLVSLMTFVNTKYATVVADCLGQINAVDPVTAQDVFLPHVPPHLFQPDVLITCGLSLISKSLKLFLRNNPPKRHIHVLPAGAAPDTFRALTDVVYAEPAAFFSLILSDYHSSPEKKSEFHHAWSTADAEGYSLPWKILRDADQQLLTEFTAIAAVLPLIAPGTALHLANSMAVRYVNILGVPLQQIEVFANRGTSGIDGCTSTAVGAALAQPERPVVLLTGDVAFFYDRNAFWHNYPTPNLRVVLLNNHGGGIFRLIDGPRQQPELEEFFETRQPLRAENTARDFGLRYFAVSTFAELESALPVFFAAEGGAALLEITTDSQTNAAFFEQYRAAVKTAFTT